MSTQKPETPQNNPMTQEVQEVLSETHSESTKLQKDIIAEIINKLGKAFNAIVNRDLKKLFDIITGNDEEESQQTSTSTNTQKDGDIEDNTKGAGTDNSSSTSGSDSATPTSSTSGSDNTTPTSSTSGTDNTTPATGSDSSKTTDSHKESKEKEPKNTALVSVEKYIRDIKIDMRYATKNNFTGEVVYNNSEAKLRYGTIKKLHEAQETLKRQGYSLKIWDAYRPQSAQDKFKKIIKDPGLVAQGKSDHTKGCAVDVTLVKADGTELPMPSEFDDFNDENKCKSDFSAVSGEAKKNGQILQKAMTDAGFQTIKTEWWHFYDTDKGKYSYI